MLKRSTISQLIPALLANLFAFIQAHRPAFRQERPFLRAWVWVLAEFFAFARHTVIQELCTLRDRVFVVHVMAKYQARLAFGPIPTGQSSLLNLLIDYGSKSSLTDRPQNEGCAAPVW